MSITTLQRFPAARARRMRALYEMVRNKEDWTKPISASVDEPAFFAYLSEDEREAAREAMMRDLQDAVALHTGESPAVYVVVNGGSVRYHVRAAAYQAPARSITGMRLFG